MAAEQEKSSGQHSSDMDRAAIRFAIKKAKRSLRWRSVWPALALGLSLGVICAALWIALMRFTLVELPAWPAVFLYAVCVVTVVVWAFTRPVSASRAARYLDRHLALDERLSTLLELQRGGSAATRHGAARYLPPEMLAETSASVMERLGRLPMPLRWRASPMHASLILASVIALGVVMTVPTPLDAVRSERAALKKALEARLGDLEALRLDIAADPLITPDAKRKLDAELWELEQKLRTPGLGRTELVAALSDAEAKVRELSTTPVSAFDSLLEAAQMVVDRAVNTSFWVEDILVSDTELSRAADAAGYLSRFATRFSVDEERSIALTFDQSALVTGKTHPLFTTDFEQAAEAIRTGDGAGATREIERLARRFREADGALHTSQALERTMSKLDESRHDVAQAGAVAKKRGQVGFRRRDASAQVRSTPSASSTDSGSLPSANTPRPAQGIAPDAQAGTNAGGPPAAQAGKTASPGAGGQEGMPGPPRSGDSTKGSTTSPAGGGSASEGEVQGPAQSGQGTGGEGDKPGTLQGPVSGPVGGTSGAISKVPNPEGSGTGGSKSAGGSPNEVGGDELTLPEPPSSDAGTAPSDPGSAGRGGEGGRTVGDTGATEERSGGGLTGVKTPYKEVVGEYTERANKALERTYIPSDAKEYVKRYFTLLGK